jgi:SAM-dependent methyltransferase
MASSRTYFGADYRASVERILTAERTAAEVSFMLETTGLRPPARIADFGCGHGRHAIELARHGFDVVGIDLNAESLSLARTAAGSALPVSFVQADYGSPPLCDVHLALSLFGSFGFGDDDDNARTLRAWSDVSRAGGWLVLELWHRDHIVSHFEPRRVWRASERLEVSEDRHFDVPTRRIHVHYDYAFADGRLAEHDLVVRLYSPAEISELLVESGLTIERLYGSLRGDAYSIESRSFTIFARKQL